MAESSPFSRPGPKRRMPRVDRRARQASYVRIAAETFHDLGLQRAAMRDIAERAGVAKILIYRQFASKEAQLAAMQNGIRPAVRTTNSIEIPSTPM